jgi:hypothetical protein
LAIADIFVTSFTVPVSIVGELNKTKLKQIESLNRIPNSQKFQPFLTEIRVWLQIRISAKHLPLSQPPPATAHLKTSEPLHLTGTSASVTMQNISKYSREEIVSSSAFVFGFSALQLVSFKF